MTLRTEPQPIPRRALASAEPYGGTAQILGPVRRLFRERPILWDLVLALGGFAVAAMPTAYAAQTQLHAALVRPLVLLAISCAPLVLRSRWPVPVAAAAVAADFARMAVLPLAMSPVPAATAIALYTVANSPHRNRARVVGACACVVLATGAVLFRHDQGVVPECLFVSAWTGLAVAAGDSARSRRDLLTSVTERAERAERTREQEARRRVAEERIRIARELHDVVAHHITLVNAQAGVAHHLMRSDPEHAYAALGRIRDTSRAALDELRATVGLLRYDDEAAAPHGPAPSLADLQGMLDAFEHAGLTVEVERTGEPRALPPIIELTAYRIVQEALTNTHKHAGTPRARVLLDYAPEALRITVADDGPALPAVAASVPASGFASGFGSGWGSGLGSGSGSGAGSVSASGSNLGAGSSAPQPAAGYGMIGMRERAQAVGGSLAAAPDPDGGFRVLATIPLRPERKDKQRP